MKTNRQAPRKPGTAVLGRPPLVEQRFRTMADAAPTMIWMSGSDGGCTFFNQPWLDFTGRPIEQQLGSGWADSVHKDDLDQCMTVYSQAFRARRRFEVEYRLRRADGNYRWVFDAGSPLFSRPGAFLGFIGSCVDVTERKLMEQALRESEDRNRDLVENSGILFGTHDLEGVVLSANRPAASFYGAEKAEELVGRKITGFLVPAVRHRFDAYLEEVLKTGHAQGLMKVTTRNGEERFLEYNNSLRSEGLRTPIVRCIGRDVTEQRRAEQALRETKERYRLVAENSRDLIKLLDPRGKILYSSPSHLAVLGYAPPDLVGRSVCEIIHPDDQPLAGAALKDVVESHAVKTLELRIPTKGGSVLQVEAILSSILDKKGNVHSVLLTARDITERKRAEQVSLSQTAALTRTLSLLAKEPNLETFLGHVLRAITEQLSCASSALYVHDPEGRADPIYMTYKDGSVLQGSHETGFIRSQRGSALCLHMTHTRLPQVVENAAENPLLSPEMRAWAASHGVKIILLVPLLLGDTLIGILSVRARENRAYRADEIELAQALAHQATLAVQLTWLAEQGKQSTLVKERNRMAQEIHDTLAQGFTGIIIQLEAAADALGDGRDEVRRHIENALQLARESLTEARRSVWALRPRLLESGDLAAAIGTLLEQLSQGGSIRAQLKVEGTVRQLSAETEANLLRIGQEALTNSVRHARATSVLATLTFERHRVRLCIQDDGVGFDPRAEGADAGFGLRSMRERASRIGGRLRINCRPGRGTHIEVTIPVRSK